MDKILIIGSSFVNPNYFNQRIKLEDRPDRWSIATIIEDIYGIKPTVHSRSGSGNSWVSDCVISNIDDIDENTLVVLSWSDFERYDLYLKPHKTNDELSSILGMPKSSLMEKRVKKDPHFMRTYDVNGNQCDSGLRFWITGSYNNFGIKKTLWESILSRPWVCKDSLERITLVQNLLKSKGARQIHFFVDDGFDMGFKDFNKLLKASDIDSTLKTYQKLNIDIPPLQPHLVFDENPELEPWYDMVDWNLFTEKSYFGYFSESDYPWYAGDNDFNYHQPPINLYRFVCDQLLECEKDKEEEYINITKQFCEEYSCHYPF